MKGRVAYAKTRGSADAHAANTALYPGRRGRSREKGGRRSIGPELRLHLPGRLLRRIQLGKGRERHAPPRLRAGLRQGRRRALRAGLHPLRGPAQPVRRFRLCPARPLSAIFRPLRRLFHDGGVPSAGFPPSGRRLRQKSCRPHELTFLFRGAAVPLPARIRQRPNPHQPVDRHGRGRAHPRGQGAGTLCHLRHARAHRGRRHHGLQQHGRSHGPRRLRHPRRALFRHGPRPLIL